MGCSRTRRRWQSQGFGGQLSWDRSAEQGYDSSGRPPKHLWVCVPCLLLPRLLVTCLLTSSLLISLMTLGFHTALRAAKACSVRMRKVFLFLQSLFYICAVFKGMYILPSTPTHLFLPKITLHFLFCRCRDSQLSDQGCEIVGMEQNGGKTLAEMCMWEGRGVGGQGVFMEPCLEGAATCVARKHFKLTTGERSVE